MKFSTKSRYALRLMNYTRIYAETVMLLQQSG